MEPTLRTVRAIIATLRGSSNVGAKRNAFRLQIGGDVHVANSLASVAMVVALLAGEVVVSAQEPMMVSVDGHTMRVQIAGLDRRTKAPAVVFESGGGDTLDRWSAILADIAQVAPAVAYDRAGLGRSEPDGEVPTPRHVAQNLRRLLEAAGVQPPYVLVGHSWGGPLIRMFAALFPQDVVGMVYVDPTDLHSRAEEEKYLRDTGSTAAAARQYIERYREQFAGYVRSLGSSVRPEMEVVEAIENADAPEFKGLPPISGIPISVLMAGRFEPELWSGRPCEPRTCHESRLRFRREWLKPLTPDAQGGRVVVDATSGHVVPDDNPALVAAEIRGVLVNAGTGR